MDGGKRLFHNIRGDLSGAVAAAVIAIPSAIGLGITAFAALGPAYTAQAAVAGVYCAVFAGFFAPLLGGTSILVTGTRSSLALVLASVVGSLVQLLPLSGHDVSLPGIVTLTFLCAFLGGLFQVLFGLLRLGDIAKYIPYPVIAGFMNGVVLLIVYSQVGFLLGLDANPRFWHDPAWLETVKPLSLLVGFSTLAAVYGAGRFLKRVPASLAGLIAGTAVYYLFRFVSGPASLGPVIGTLAVAIPAPVMVPGFWELVSGDGLYYLRLLLFPALILGVFGSVESLMSAAAADNAISERHDSNRVLLGQGIGNMVASLFGGIAGAGTVASTMANYRAGGRTALAGMSASIMMLLVVILFGRLVGMIPLAAIAGILITVGIAIFDRWSLNLLRKALKSAEIPPEARTNLLLTLLVTVLTITVNLVIAIALGFGVATALFLSKTGRSIIHRRFSGSELTSKKVRTVDQSLLLQERGARILVLELYGPIFFGSAEKLAHEIEKTAQEVRYLILDMKRVNEIDSTGAKILGRIHGSFKEKGKELLVGYLTESHPSWASLVDMGVIAALGRGRLFADTDRALEWAEECLLDTLSAATGTGQEMELEAFDVLKDFTEQERRILRERLQRKVYTKGALVVQEGTLDRDLLFLTKGEVSIGIALATGSRSKRLATYGPGAVFGEVELLDGSPRSADVWADTDAEIYRLTPEGFEFLRLNNPGIVHKLILSLARELGIRLRMANRELRLLEDS